VIGQPQSCKLGAIVQSRIELEADLEGIVMVRSVFAAALAVAMFAGPVMAQTTDMVTYADTMRKKSGAHSAVHPVTRGAVSGKHAAGMKHTVAAKHTASAKHAAAKGKHHN
jgi:hypothetical protein